MQKDCNALSVHVPTLCDLTVGTANKHALTVRDVPAIATLSPSDTSIALLNQQRSTMHPEHAPLVLPLDFPVHLLALHAL